MHPDASTPGAACEPSNFRSDVLEGKNALGQSCAGYGARHSPNGAGCLVLCQHGSSLFADETGAGESVGAHTGENNREYVGAVECGRSAKKYIDCWTAMVSGAAWVK